MKLKTALRCRYLLKRRHMHESSYSASKASESDHLVRAGGVLWSANDRYQLFTNNYGPYHFLKTDSL